MKRPATVVLFALVVPAACGAVELRSPGTGARPGAQIAFDDDGSDVWW